MIKNIPVPFSGLIGRGAAVVLMMAASGCSFVPRDGPASVTVRDNADVTLLDTAQLSYAFVSLTPLTLPMFRAQPQAPIVFSRAAAMTRTPDVRIGVGDVVSVSVFEAGGGGLFLPESPAGRAGSVLLPAQQVNQAGEITVPFVGQVKVLGRAPLEVQRDIEDRLKGRAIEPQVVVSVPEQRANEVTVLGEVRSPAQIPVDPNGIRLMEALARAGGTIAPHFESIITLQRQGRTERALLTHVVQGASQNVNLLPGDIVFVSREPRSYLAFGATLSSSGGLVGSSNRRYVFNEPNLTLADGVAQAGGLLDSRADASAVFLFRLVPKTTLQKAGIDVSRFAGPLVPTIFNANWTRPEGLFIANEFYLQHRDIIFVSNAPSQDVSKYLTFLNEVLSTITSAVDTATAVETFFSGSGVGGARAGGAGG